MFFKNLKIGQRLGLGFGLVLFILIGAGVAGIWGTHKVSQEASHILQTDAKIAQYSALSRKDVLELRRSEKDTFLNMGNPEKQSDYMKKWNESREDLLGKLSSLDNITEEKEDKDIVGSMRMELAAYTEGFSKVTGRIKEGSIKTPQDANKAIDSYKDPIHKMQDLANKLAKLAADRMDEQTKLILAFSFSVRWTIIALLAVASVFGIVVSMLTTRRITRPLLEGVDMSANIAKGDLSVSDLAVKSNDELGYLAGTLNKMKKSLTGMISSIVNTSTHVASSSEELSVTVQQIKKRVDEQTDKASQVATASTEMSQTAIDIAKNASNIAASAKDTAEVASEGSMVVNKTIGEVKEIADMVTESSKMMSSLGERSKQIGAIVTVINEIADQTNLLALNAAIEAARAGDQGRGFAVVADEVKKLAERTTRATTEIGEMIRSIQSETGTAIISMEQGLKKVETGVELSTQAGKSLDKIVDSINGLKTMVEQIATATEEMSSVSEQISDNIEAIASLSKETSSSSNEIANASEDLSNLSVGLKELVEQFKISDEGASTDKNGNIIELPRNARRPTSAPQAMPT